MFKNVEEVVVRGDGGAGSGLVNHEPLGHEERRELLHHHIRVNRTHVFLVLLAQGDNTSEF